MLLASANFTFTYTAVADSKDAQYNYKTSIVYIL